jgi:hypothetical protein
MGVEGCMGLGKNGGFGSTWDPEMFLSVLTDCFQILRIDDNQEFKIPETYLSNQGQSVIQLSDFGVSLPGSFRKVPGIGMVNHTARGL